MKRGSETLMLSVFVLVAPTDAAGATRTTDAFFDRSANDLKDAIEGVEGLSIEVTSADRWGEYPVAGLTYQGFRLVAEVFLNGTALADIRAAVAAAVTGKGDPPLIGYDYPPASLTTPCAVVEPEEINFRAP